MIINGQKIDTSRKADEASLAFNLYLSSFLFALNL